MNVKFWHFRLEKNFFCIKTALNIYERDFQLQFLQKFDTKHSL